MRSWIKGDNKMSNDNNRGILEGISTLNAWKIQELKEEVKKNNNITWFLGAGISAPFGIPLWDGLLKRMWVRLANMRLEKELSCDEKSDDKDCNSINKIYTDFLKQNDLDLCWNSKYMDTLKDALKGNNMDQFDNLNLLEFAEYINNLIKIDVGNTYKKELYDIFLKSIIKDSLYYTYNPKDNTAVNVLAEYLIKPPIKHKTVITYNYDEILEMALIQKDSNIRSELNIISNNRKKEKGINIYHVHGFLPKSKIFKDDESDSVVLTETSYEEIGNRAYSWVNNVQANAILNSVCVFLGFSGQDQNFRRILKNINVNEDIKVKYMFVTIDSYTDKSPILNKHDATKEEILFEYIQLNNYLYSQERYWEKYNIRPIWTTKDGLPDMLKDIIIS